MISSVYGINFRHWGNIFINKGCLSKVLVWQPKDNFYWQIPFRYPSSPKLSIYWYEYAEFRRGRTSAEDAQCWMFWSPKRSSKHVNHPTNISFVIELSKSKVRVISETVSIMVWWTLADEKAMCDMGIATLVTCRRSSFHRVMYRHNVLHNLLSVQF